MVLFRKWVVALIAASAVSLAGCSDNSKNTSDVLVTDVDHTIVKRQSIGNCWLYAQATWLESLLLSQTGEEVDVSESYWTWWNWYDQIVGSSIQEVQTGGYWGTSASIIMRHGFVTEGEFISSEQDVEMSLHQSQALAAINQALKPGGALANRSQRTAANVRQQLDLAFGSNMQQSEGLARSANSTLVGPNTTLAQALNGSSSQRWNNVRFPSVYGQNTPVPSYVQQSRKALLQRVMRALNDHKPVVMSVMIDFNGLDINDQTFKKSLVDANGLGTQGGHMVVLEDYTVDNVPGYGYIGEGEATDEMKAAALNGDIVLLKAKNSWGKNRPDRGLTDGYTRFDAAYLFSQMEWKRGEDSDVTSFYTTLNDFVLPPGY